ncbi:MAG TPA: hypothetical protein VJT31_36075 [Rugosimonospora sp.]|nr:hypothetical protein [Rugosimonospora sp.]
MSSNVPQWWVVDPAGRVLTGPCADRVEAEARRDVRIAALADAAGVPDGDPDAARAAYGVRRPDGTLEERQSPEDKAWLAHLHEQLSRVRASAAHGDLAVEIGTALVESGFELHHCDAHDPRGGVCLTPTSATSGEGAGVIVAWTQHDRQAKAHIRGYDAYVGVQETMNYALADVLAALGFTVQPFGQATAHLVVAGPTDLRQPQDAAVEEATPLPPAAPPTPTVRVDECRHATGAVDIVSLLGPADSRLGVPTNDGRAMGGAEGTCADCGARVVTVNIYDPTQPWTIEHGHGGTDRSIGWTAWR